MNKLEYHYWDLSENDLDVMLYNVLAPFMLTSHEYDDLNDFKLQNPPLAYAYCVDERYRLLNELVVSLRAIPQMLGVSQVPIVSSVKALNHYEWLTITLDLALFRFSSVRDCCYFLVREVFELELKDRNTLLGSLKKSLLPDNQAVISILENIADVGELLREQRNKRAHQGSRFDIGSDTFIFKIASDVHSMFGNPSFDPPFDLDKEYQKETLTIYQEFKTEVEPLLEEVSVLLDLLAKEFNQRFQSKHQQLSNQ